jgi:UDP-2-acetamido-3-amino-2,3-dideoxy-glucuronate N-acetyltransferase
MFALIGCGYWGIKIMRTLKHQIGTVCENRPDIIDLIKEEFRGVSIEPDWQKLLKNDGIKNVMIALPAELHFKFAKDALLANKNVFVEKPLSIHLSEVEELVKLAEQKGLILMMGHLLHYHPHLNQIKKMVKSGEIGRVLQIRARRMSYGIFRKYDNVLWTVGIHDLSWILSLIDLQSITHSTLKGSNLTNHSNLDMADVTLTTNDGIDVSVSCNWISPHKEQSLVIYGTEGVIYADDVKKEFFSMDYQGNKTSIEPGEQYLPLAIECHHFVTCCQTNQEPDTSARRVYPVYQLLDRLERQWQGESANHFAHPTATIDAGVKIGQGSKIWHHCHLSNDSSIGRDCSLGQNVYLGDQVVLGDRCRLQNNANVYSGTIAGSDVFFGPNCVITNDKHPRIGFSLNGEYVRTTIEDHVSIGAGAIIIAGVKLGRGAMIGAGAVVTRDVEPYTLVVGNPARRIADIDEEGKRINAG